MNDQKKYFIIPIIIGVIIIIGVLTGELIKIGLSVFSLWYLARLYTKER